MEGCKLCGTEPLLDAMSSIVVSKCVQDGLTRKFESGQMVWICMTCVRRIKSLFKDF